MFYEPGKTDHGLPHDPFKSEERRVFIANLFPRDYHALFTSSTHPMYTSLLLPPSIFSPSFPTQKLTVYLSQACVVPRPIGWISTISPNPNTHPHPSSTSKSDPTTSIPEGTPNLAPYSQFQNLTFSPPCVMFSANQTPDNLPKDSAFNAKATGVFCWQLATYALREAVNITSEQVPFGTDEFERAGLKKTWSKSLKVPVPMVEESPVRFECEYHDTIHLAGNPPMGSADIVIGKVVGVHIKDEVLTNGKLDISKTMPIARCGYYEYAVIKETFEMMMPGDQIMRVGLEGNSKKQMEYGGKQVVPERGGSPQIDSDKVE